MYTMHFDHSHKTAVPTELLQDLYLSVDAKGLLLSSVPSARMPSSCPSWLTSCGITCRTSESSARSWSFTTCVIWTSGKRATTSI